jgi:ubiquitin-like protein ATG12
MSTSHPHRNLSTDLSESQLLPTSGHNPSSSPQGPSSSSISSPLAPSCPSPDPDADDPGAGPDLPLSLSTSTLLTTTLPTDARSALATLASTLDPPTHKITVRFQAIGDAPPLKVKVAKVSASHTFATVVRFLRKRLYGNAPTEGGGAAGGEGVADGGGSGVKRKEESLFCYVNSVFAPGLDEGVGNLWRVSTNCSFLS